MARRAAFTAVRFVRQLNTLVPPTETTHWL
jgi:hypothetical protein